MVIDAYGGHLVTQMASPAERERRLGERKDLPVLTAIVDQVYDAEKIAIGAYSPLTGFMNKKDYESVLNRLRLDNGMPWTMPILFTPNSAQAPIVQQLKASDEVLIADWTGSPFALLRVEDKFPIDRKAIGEKIFLTTDPAHPNVGDLAHFGDIAIGGKVTLLRRLEFPHQKFELTPAETREHFAKMGWKHVAGYQARNPPHTAHEYIQRLTLEREDVDGLLIHPVVGKLKKGDYKPEVIMRAYEAFVKNYYPEKTVHLGSLSISMRYAGPNAALFLAIVRRNYGCDHYIVGRDMAGVGKYYDPYACHRIFDQFDIGVTPVRYGEAYYCKLCGWMASPKTCSHGPEARLDTSQTLIRKLLAEGKPLPTELLRPEVAEVLRGGNVMLT